MLLIEDNPGDTRLIREMLRDTGSQSAAIDLSVADRLAAGLERLQDEKVHLVLLDLTLPDSTGLRPSNASMPWRAAAPPAGKH